MNNTKHQFPWLYLLLVYGLTWLFWIPVALTRQDYQESPLLLAVVFLDVFGPGTGEYVFRLIFILGAMIVASTAVLANA